MVSPVLTGDIAEITSDTEIVINAGHLLERIHQAEVIPVTDLGRGLSHQFFDPRESAVIEIVIQPLGHLPNHAKPVMHSARADLNGTRAEQHEFNRIAPRFNPADSAQGHWNLGIVI